jgi:uncharacterized protein YcsI (UPF0317 family)
MAADPLRFATGADVRRACRSGEWTGPTCGLAEGFTQANLVILPADWAYDFLLFCRRNPKPCPLLDVTETGSPVPTALAAGADLRTDLPKYRVWEHGVLVEEPVGIEHLWRDDLVAFLIGCSFTFEAALVRSGVPVRHLELGCNVPMYRTSIACRSAGRFHGPLVVSMRPLSPADAIRAVQITSRFPDVHGAPVHLGFPEQIGITDLRQPDYGDPVPVADEELPVFWACGVTPQAAAVASRPPLMITHSPGCMFVTDIRDDSLSAG